MKPQINLRLPEGLKKVAEKYAKAHRYRNLQELATEAIREKVMEKDFDESFTNKEIELIDKFIDATIRKGDLVNEKGLRKALR
ncbi:MAG: hypothetical protein HY051_01335 [Candidatus Aenigmarchaeota archaeon]|nr:hypothetical protein [Candidatus Aenigmarchaeota archaeon]